MANLFQSLSQAASSAPALSLPDYLGLLVAQISATPMRTLIPSHPRLAVYGLLEARLVSADVMILGGLNENIWPEEAEIDPWLSRPMKRQLGLMLPERRLGLTAHDFVQAFSGAEIYLSSAQKRDGTPAVASRWLLRLEALLQAADLKGLLQPDSYWTGLALGLDGRAKPSPCPPPHPKPALQYRPRRISVTQAEKLINDPYAFYARHILQLEPLAKLGPGEGAGEKGKLWHKILEAFTQSMPGDFGSNGLSKLIAIGEEKFAKAQDQIDIHAFWWPQFLRAASWFLEQEKTLRQNITQQLCEKSGALEIVIAGEPIKLTARADRIDVHENKTIRILDYKTGEPPSGNQLENGKAPQLPLEAYIAAQGGFLDVGKAESFSLAVMKLSGGYPAGKMLLISENVMQIAEQNYSGLCQLLTAYMQQTQAYLPFAEDKKREDYDHLARYLEWQPGLSGEFDYDG